MKHIFTWKYYKYSLKHSWLSFNMILHALEYRYGWNNVCKLQGFFIYPLGMYIQINIQVWSVWICGKIVWLGGEHVCASVPITVPSMVLLWHTDAYTCPPYPVKTSSWYL